jgi:MFS family permease
VSQRPTYIRYLVLFATALVAVFMYVDRVCLAGVRSDIQRELVLSDVQMDWVFSAFFWSYALAQVVAGVLAIRYGFRKMLAIYLFVWSLFTVLTGLANGLILLLASRLLVGLAEAGAYPTAAALVKNWFPLSRRGFANSMVALGGRLGGAIGQRMTPLLVVLFASYSMSAHGAVAGGPVAALVYDSAASGWRQTLMLFGVVGMVYAVVYWFIARDSARQHPLSNSAEAELVPVDAVGESRESFPWSAILTSRNLWISSITQCGLNIGWAFLVTGWPDYLEKVHGLTGNEKGYWAAWPLTVGIFGMFLGGFLTDALTKRLGLRWGRALPVGLALFVCALALGGCASSADYKVVVLLLCCMTICVDVGVPALWAFAQDIGGRQVGPVLGWANMWGNIGAALSPLLLGVVQRNFGWPAVFTTCSILFAIAGLSGLMLNAKVPLKRPK